MNQKGFTNIIIAVVVLVGLVGYAVIKKTEPTNQQLLSTTTSSVSNGRQNQIEEMVYCTQDVKLCPDGSYVSRIGPNCEFAACPEINYFNWELLISKVREVVKKEFNRAGSDYPIRIVKTADVTGDGISEALVDLGMPGATMDLLTVLRIENGQPVVAKFKTKDKKISVIEFASGSGGSGRYSNFVDFLSEEKAISAGGYVAYGQPSDYCSFEIFKWNSNTKLFEYDLSLSQEFSAKKCKELCEVLTMDTSLLKYICK